MIITRSPLRISLGGGGTDLPSYYQDHEGFLVAAAIDKYVYIALHHTFEPQFLSEFILKYSETERAKRIEDIRHPLIRETLRFVGVTDQEPVEFASMADIPAGTGLGSSGSFITALLKALYSLRRTSVTNAELAEHAAQIEIERLNNPVGKQDQYIASFGGLTSFQFHRDGKVTVKPVQVSREAMSNLEDSLALFFTGTTRSATEILQDQDGKTKRADPAMIANLHHVKSIGLESAQALESGKLARLGELMREHWELKKKRSAGMTDERIEQMYAVGMKNGAFAGKIVGAGGGGFLLFLSADRARLRSAMSAIGAPEVRIRFDLEGTKIVQQ